MQTGNNEDCRGNNPEQARKTMCLDRGLLITPNIRYAVTDILPKKNHEAEPVQLQRDSG